MLVDISVGSRFHAFDLARELDLRGLMGTLHTGYPSFSASRFGLRGRILRSVWSHEPLNRLGYHLHRIGLVRRSLDAELSGRFDRIVAERLRPGADIFVGWSSQCLRSIRRARDLGMVTVVERGSSHVLWQRQILEEERRLSGLPAEVPSAETIECELEEYATADYVAVPTMFAARTFGQHGVRPEKILINPYGVDVSRYAAVKPMRESAQFRVIHVGRCSVQKGVHHLIQAVGQVERGHLTFVGGIEPGIRPILEKKYTTVVGPVPGSQLASYYAAADVFCLLSVQEGLALVIAQAMASGLPVIVTPNTGGEELVTDGVEGFVVPIRSPAVVAERLCWLRDNPQQRLAMGQRARARVQAGFSWSDYGNRAVANYERISNERRVKVAASHGK